MYDSKMYIHLTSLLSPLHFLPLKSTFILYVLGSIDFCKYLEEISEEINLPDSTNKNWQIKFPSIKKNHQIANLNALEIYIFLFIHQF